MKSISPHVPPESQQEWRSWLQWNSGCRAILEWFLYAAFTARPAIQRRLNAAVIILLKWPILMTWIIALLTLGLFVYLFYALIKPEKF
jgi:K+-transporting ATPase KdpF subunit